MGHELFQSFVIFPCHEVMISYLENNFSAALCDQQLAAFLFHASFTTHSIQSASNQHKMQVGQRYVE